MAGLDLEALDLPLAREHDAERPVRFRSADVLLPVGAVLEADEFRCCSCGYRHRGVPATCPICAARAWEAASRA